MKTIAIVLGAALLAAPAHAASDVTPALPSAQASTALSAEEFAEFASMSSLYEIEAGRVALEKSKNARVREFAQVMISDHAKALTKLKSVHPAGVVNQLDDLRQRFVHRLRSTPAEDFDNAYVADQTTAHQDAVAWFTGYAAKGDNARLKAYAQETLPVLEGHLEHVKKLN